MRPMFIAIEGLDGSGGTTQVHLLAEWLAARGISVHTTAEPTRGPVGRFIRASLDPTTPEGRLGDAVLPYLFAADRRDHLDREIIPTMQTGCTVVSDRYYHSSLAYQSLAVGLAKVVQLNEDFRPPDLTVFLDLAPEVCLERILARGGVRERFEALDRMRDIRDAYEAVLVYCRTRGEEIVRVDAEGDIATVFERVLEVVEPMVIEIEEESQQP